MSVSKKPRKRAKVYPERFTSTPFSQVEVRLRMAYERVRIGLGLDTRNFDHLAMAQRLTCLLRLSEEEADWLSRLETTLNELRQQRLPDSSTITVNSVQQASLLECICVLEAIWSRYPKRHLEACYDKEMKALYQKITDLIDAKKTGEANEATIGSE